MYQLTHLGHVLRLADQACIPPDPANADYRDYLDWLDAGNVPAPPGPLPVPHRVSAWQIRKALNIKGWRADVEAFIASDQADQTMKDGWHHEQNFYRDDPLVVGTGLILGKTEAEMDDFFRLADTL